MSLKENKKDIKDFDKKNGQKNKKGFDVDCICDALKKFNEDESSLKLKDYLIAYKELEKFFENLGTIFSFVASDVDSKIVLLEDYLNNEAIGENYFDIQTMLNYEKNENLLNDTKRISGARTLLRLHRALEFISFFITNVTNLEDHENTNSVASSAYDKTLSKYHPWLIRKAAKLAMYALPIRSILVERVFKNYKDLNRDQINESMIKISKLTEKAYENTQRLFEEHDLLNLP